MIIQWIKNKIYTFTTCQFCCWNKIAISRNKDNSIYQFFIC